MRIVVYEKTNLTVLDGIEKLLFSSKNPYRNVQKTKEQISNFSVRSKKIRKVVPIWQQQKQQKM